MAEGIRVVRRGVPYFRSWKTLDGGPGSEQIKYSVLDYVEHGANIPGWRNLIRTHQNATTYLSGAKTDVEKAPGSGALYAHTVPSFPVPLKIQIDTAGDLSPLSPDFSIVGNLTDVESEAMTTFLRKCYNKQRTMSSIVAAGELGQTIRMLRNPMGTLFGKVGDYLSFLRRKRRGLTRKKKNQFLQETWLEYSFGWLPLLSDIKDAAEAAARLAGYVSEVEYVKGEAADTDASMIGTGAGAQSQLKWKYKVRQDNRVYCKINGAIRSRVESPPGFVAQTWGFDPRSFIPSIWNLIPFSFLVDYFTNTGEFLEALNFNIADVAWAKKQTARDCVRYITEFETEPHLLNPAIWVVDRWYVHPSSVKIKRREVTREPVGTDALVASWRFRLPNRPLWKAANIAALAASARSMTPY